MNDQQYNDTFALLRLEAKRIEKIAKGRVRGRPAKDSEAMEFHRQSYFHMKAILNLPQFQRKAYIAKVRENNAQLIAGLDVSHQVRAYTRRLRNPNWTIPKNLKNSQRQSDREKAARLELIALAIEKLNEQGIRLKTKTVHKMMKLLAPSSKLVALDTLRKDIKSLKAARSSRLIN